MTIRGRSIIIAVLLAVSSCLYGAARCYAPILALHVVEQTLLQKAPEGISKSRLRERFHALLAQAQDPAAKMARLFAISERLEKAQTLTPEELEELLAADEE